MSRFTTAAASLAMPALAGAVVFVSAGRWDLPFVWGVLAILAVFCVLFTATADRGLVRERVAPGAGNRDRVTRPIGTALIVSHWVLAGLDAGRWQWTPVPWGVQAAGLLGYAAAMVVVFWAVTANPFYSSVVRLQADRGHRAVTGGPYRFVRHPGYAGTLAAAAAGGLALGSWLAMVPLAVLAVLFVRRTLLEDRMLREELPGYAEYARRVRYRLIVGVF